MTLQQLRYICEIERQGLHLSQAAAALHTSQPGVSRQIQLLEEELGIKILHRRRNRILGLTQPGKEILRYAQRVLRDTESLQNVAFEFRQETSGSLVIATNHTHARYTLPKVISAFSKTHPSVRLEFWQGGRNEIFRWLDLGEVDIAIGADSDIKIQNVLLLPCGKFHRVVVTPADHPLLLLEKIGLEDIAKYPIIAHSHAWHTRGEQWRFEHIFKEKKLNPNIVFRSIDAEISKAYVGLGVGIAILPHITFDALKDTDLRAINVKHLFASETMRVGINKGKFYRQYVFDFLELFSPDLSRRRVERLLAQS